MSLKNDPLIRQYGFSTSDLASNGKKPKSGQSWKPYTKEVTHKTDNYLIKCGQTIRGFDYSLFVIDDDRDTTGVIDVILNDYPTLMKYSKTGRHLYYFCKNSVRTANLRSKGFNIDIKGVGGYVKAYAGHNGEDIKFLDIEEVENIFSLLKSTSPFKNPPSKKAYKHKTSDKNFEYASRSEKNMSTILSLISKGMKKDEIYNFIVSSKVDSGYTTKRHNFNYDYNKAQKFFKENIKTATLIQQSHINTSYLSIRKQLFINSFVSHAARNGICKNNKITISISYRQAGTFFNTTPTTACNYLNNTPFIKKVSDGDRIKSNTYEISFNNFKSNIELNKKLYEYNLKNIHKIEIVHDAFRSDRGKGKLIAKLYNLIQENKSKKEIIVELKGGWYKNHRDWEKKGIIYYDELGNLCIKSLNEIAEILKTVYSSLRDLVIYNINNHFNKNNFTLNNKYTFKINKSYYNLPFCYTKAGVSNVLSVLKEVKYLDIEYMTIQFINSIVNSNKYNLING